MTLEQELASIGLAEPKQELDLSLVGTVEQALQSLSTANTQTFKVVERLAKGEPVTYAEIFADGRGLNVFGQLLPDLPEFHQPVDQKTAEVLVKRYISTAKSLQTAVKRVERYNHTFQKKMERRIKALSRSVKGFSKLQKQYLQTIRVEDLEPFAGEGEYRNSLVFGRKGVITLNYYEAFDVELDVNYDMSKLLYAVLDHTEAFRMATGRSRVDRTVKVSVIEQTPNGPVKRIVRMTNGKITTSHETPAHGEPAVQVQLTYELHVPKSMLDTVLIALESLSLPVYSPSFFSYLESMAKKEEAEDAA